MIPANTPTHSSDEDIISNLLQNGRARVRGEEDLFNSYSYFIREGMHKYSITQEDAFDAYSDTILSAIPKIQDRSFEGRSSLKTWLFQIFHNKCVDLVRKNATHKNKVHKTQEVSDMIVHLSDTSKSIIQQLVEKADWDKLKRKLNEIGQNCKDLLMLSADGYTDREIVEMMTYKTADVVKTTRLRCLEKLRQLYKNNP